MVGDLVRLPAGVGAGRLCRVCLVCRPTAVYVCHLLVVRMADLLLMVLCGVQEHI